MSTDNRAAQIPLQADGATAVVASEADAAHPFGNRGYCGTQLRGDSGSHAGDDQGSRAISPNARHIDRRAVRVQTITGSISLLVCTYARVEGKVVAVVVGTMTIE